MGDDAGLANHRYAVAAADERQQRGEDAGVRGDHGGADWSGESL